MMIKKLVYLILLVLAFVLQDTWVPLFSIAGMTANLPSLMLVFTAFLSEPLYGLLAGLGIGLLQDILGGKYFGLHILTKGLTGWLISCSSSKIYKENYLLPIIMTFFGTILIDVLYVGFSWLVGLNIPWGKYLFNDFVGSGIYNAVLAPFIYIPVYLFFLRPPKED
ncbi:MAG: rod shape-determining protein MreD [Clostridiales bacterium]